MPTIGPLELLVILIIALIVFGPKRLPELGASLGRGIREFRSSVSGMGEEEPEDRHASPRPELRSSEASREESGGRVDDEDLARQKREH